VAKGDNIREKLLLFAIDAMEVCEALPKTPVGVHISLQLLRCATSAAPNYSEARGAESGRDFLHKLRIVLKELNDRESDPTARLPSFPKEGIKGWLGNFILGVPS